ncbi:MAG: hypothetical protein APF76_09960 [Desulfitibacter sp. BRH_c19]|nr:MAG: hypothetical protein APF76_09960 [Desulfitibacter sp. BRH_c19]
MELVQELPGDIDNEKYLMGVDIMDDSVLKIVFAVCLAGLVFLIFREVLCWYWKLNEIVHLLTEINNKLGSDEPLDGNKTWKTMDYYKQLEKDVVQNKEGQPL